MTEQITPEQFHEAPGVGDWRVVTNVACAYFRTGSFARGVELVEEIGELADTANHHPDVDLRFGGVTVRLTTHTPDHFFWLSERDVGLAQQISAAARELGVSADTTAVQDVQVTIDALVHPDVRIAAAIAAGGHLVSDEHAPAWWTLADPEGNEVDVATWMGRD